MEDRIIIEKSLIPYTFEIALPEELYTIGVSYNATADLFVLSLSKGDEVLCVGEPIVYGQQLFKDIAIDDRFPPLAIVPLDESGEQNAVTYDNFNETVFLCCT